MSEQADGALVRRVQSGEPAAAGELFKRYWRSARAAAYGVTGDWLAAEDAASEGLSKAIAGIGSLADPDRFAPWLRTIVVRTARMGLRDPSPIEGVTECLRDPRPNPDECLQRQQLIAAVQQAMRKLPETLREAIALHYFEGYDSAGAAHFLDIPTGTLRRRLHEGRKRLRVEVERVLERRKPMGDNVQPQLEKFEAMIREGDAGRALRKIFALQRPPAPLLNLLRNNLGGRRDAGEFARTAASILESQPSHASDPETPVGAMAHAIRVALPEFQEWQIDIVTAATRLFGTGKYRDRLQAVLPPVFAKGHPGNFVKSGWALLKQSEAGIQSVYEVLREDTDEPAFDRSQVVMSEVLDLTWMVDGSLELHSVHQRIAQLISEVLDGAEPAFSSYYEPRYRSAFQIHFAGVFARAAVGGVLAEWPGRPHGVDAAHVRIFLEPWALLRSGQHG
ncbi:MAG TPA: sigma-70 family RNA polymerase sigma factor [Bryobacteraceae bacterium]|nr:sigma-70 family RNA polymerase sigma factor [Bryobacteraceae bacterium]